MTTPELRPAWVEDAWTAHDLAERTGMTDEAAEMTLDTAVVDGTISRITCGDATAYLPGTVRLTGTSEGAK